MRLGCLLVWHNWWNPQNLSHKVWQRTTSEHIQWWPLISTCPQYLKTHPNSYTGIHHDTYTHTYSQRCSHTYVCIYNEKLCNLFNYLLNSVFLLRLEHHCLSSPRLWSSIALQPKMIISFLWNTAIAIFNRSLQKPGLGSVPHCSLRLSLATTI